jgi:hypothetical protein
LHRLQVYIIAIMPPSGPGTDLEHVDSVQMPA